MPDSGMFLLTFLRARHSRFGGEDKQIQKTKPALLAPSNDVCVSAMHPMIVNYVLTLEHQFAVGNQQTVTFAQRCTVMRRKLIVAIVPAETCGHSYLAPGMLSTAFDVSEKWRIENRVSQTGIRQRDCSGIRLADVIGQRRRVETQSGHSQIFPKHPVAVSQIRVKAFRAMQRLNSG
jgi:hypothetical protein